MISTASPAIQKATARVLELSEDERARLIHQYELISRLDERARLDDALEKGRTEGMVTVARNMLRRNRPFAEIAEDTGLSVDEIKKLAH